MNEQGYTKRFIKLHGAKPTSYETVREFTEKIKTDSTSRKNIYDLIVDRVGIKPEEGFTSKQILINGQKKFHVVMKKFGQTRVENVTTKDEVKKLQKFYKNWIIPKIEVINNAIGYEERREKMMTEIAERPMGKVEQYYAELTPDSYYVVDDFHLRLFNERGQQVYLMNTKGEYVESFELAKFYLLDHKIDLSNHPLVAYFKYKKASRGYWILMVLPNLNFRDNVCAFDFPNLYGEITIEVARETWKRATGFQYQIVPVCDIPSTEAYDRKIDYLKRWKESKRRAELERRKALKLDVEVLPEKETPDTEKAKAKANKWHASDSKTVQRRLDSLHNQMARPIDAKINRERKRKKETILLAKVTLEDKINKKSKRKATKKVARKRSK